MLPEAQILVIDTRLPWSSTRYVYVFVIIDLLFFQFPEKKEGKKTGSHPHLLLSFSAKII